MEKSLYLETIIQTVQDSVIFVDPNGKITAVNQATEELTGYTAEELIGSSCRILNCTGCKIQKGTNDKWCELFNKDKVKDKKCTIKNKNRHSIHILKSASVMYDKNGEIIGAVEVLSDHTETIRQQKKIETLRQGMSIDNGYHDLIGRSNIMKHLFEMIENVAQSDAPVMIHGQSGTGKELAAMAIHEASPRCDKSFIKVNCAALNENLLESELFGHVKGAFTNADRDRIGRFEAAHEGSIFLDEIGDIPLSTQIKLLRVLEEGVIERVGDHKPMPIDVRLITATNKDLEKLTEEGLFRQDLYFRINVFPLLCPVLKDRKEDIPYLIQNFITNLCLKNRKKINGVTPEAMSILYNYSWPGNVRELRNTIEYAMVLCHDKMIGIEHLPIKIIKNSKSLNLQLIQPNNYNEDRDKLLEVLNKTGGNQSKAARLLNVSRVTVWKRMKKYNIDLYRDLKHNSY